MTGVWTERPEGGNRFALRLLTSVAFLFGRAPARALLYPIALYFTLRRGAERRASREFLGRVLGRRATAFDTYRHVLCFSRVTLDRLYLLRCGTSGFEIRSSGLEEVHDMLGLGRGVLMFGAHYGSFEALRALSVHRPDFKFRAVIDLGQAPAISQLLDSLNPALAATIINARQGGVAVALAIKEGLDQGAAVTLLADRTRPGGTTCTTEFLGSPAPFPTAPWELASALRVPVILCLGTYEGGKRYHLQFEVLTDCVVRERDGGPPLSEWIRMFADRLAARVRAAPFNWFNFYDFWSG
jgi:predicted LPLAT superfamily acyltransferase